MPPDGQIPGLRLLGRSYRLEFSDPALEAAVRLLYEPLFAASTRDAAALQMVRLPAGGVRVSLESQSFDFEEPWIQQHPAAALTHALLATETRHVVLHAAAVSRHGEALIIAGASGMGKSTLAAALGERGATVLSDEFAPIDRLSSRIAPFGMRMGLREGPRPDRAGIDVDLPGERKRLFDVRHQPAPSIAEARLRAVIHLGTETAVVPSSARTRARLWFDAAPERVSSALTASGFERDGDARMDGIWSVVDVRHDELRRALHALRTQPGMPACMRVQYDDLDPLDFAAPPVLSDIKTSEGALDLARRISTAQRGPLVAGPFAGDATRFLREFVHLTRDVRFVRLRPGRLEDMLALVEGLWS